MDEGTESQSLTLGIDIGTSSIKTALVCTKSGFSVAQCAIEHCAELDVLLESNSEKWHEQDVRKLLKALDACIKRLPSDASKLVKDIIVCGQMHGCVLWNYESACNNVYTTEESLDLSRESVSSLVTWQDQRCSNEFLSLLPNSNVPLASGFGCVTLFWLQMKQIEVINRFEHAGTIMDLVVCYLCRSREVYISTQNACSWAYFDTTSNKWEIEK